MEEKSTIEEVGDKALHQIEHLVKKKAEGVVGISREGDNWTIQLEVLERKAVPDTQDILGMYEMKLDNDLNVMEYRRVRLRRRGVMAIEDDCYIN
jgi:hypothetical protein